MKKLTVGVIGAGRIGKLHTENILNHFRDVTIKAIADPYMDKDWVGQTGIEVVSADYNDVINDPEIETVLICSPSPTHAPMIIEAAQKGKHIFCEKPIALEPEVIKKALKVVEEQKVKLQVGFNRRFDPNFIAAKERISSGDIGEPQILKITSRDPEPPNPEYIKQSGGIFLDMTIHDFDMARFLADSEITEIYVCGSVMIDPEIGKQNDIDTALITLKFANGMIGNIDNSRKAVYGYDQRIEVFGSKGAVIAENNTPHNTRFLSADGIETAKPLYFFLERYHQSFINEMKAFFSAIRDKTDVPVNGTDGLMPVVIGLAANQSLIENKPIQIMY